MIHVMIDGRLKEAAKSYARPPQLVIYETAAVMLATDGGNRAQKVLLETTDPDIGRMLRSVKAGASITVTGEATFVGVSTLRVRVRTLQTLTPACVAASSTQTTFERAVCTPITTVQTSLKD